MFTFNKGVVCFQVELFDKAKYNIILVVFFLSINHTILFKTHSHTKQLCQNSEYQDLCLYQTLVGMKCLEIQLDYQSSCLSRMSAGNRLQ